jgi:antirestriction protein
MTIKQKFSSIDQSKLTADQKAFLDKIKDVTKNFTDSEMNKKVEAPLDGFIAKAKEKMPEAIKSAPAKRTSKAKPSQTRKPKRTAMSLAKEIRKEGESWNDARARASKMMKEDSKDLSKTVETELEKLTKLVRSQKSKAKLVGISKTDIGRDAVRKAKPRGSRKVTRSGETSNQYGTYKNHLGRKYYESRDRHSDRLAPNYPKNSPYLADGGYLTDPNFGNFQNNPMFNKGGAVTNERRYVNKGEDYEVRYSRPIFRRKGYEGKRDFELGGVMTTDLAGHTGGALGTGDPSLLSGNSGTGYTGLVGETGAMSSGEMFNDGGAITNERRYVNKGEDYEVRYSKPILRRKGYQDKRDFELGGGLPQGASQSYMITESLGNPAQHFAIGGTLKIKKTGRYKILGEIKGQQPILYASTDDKNRIKYLVDMAEIDLNKLTGKKHHIFVTDEVTDDEVLNYAKGGGVRQVGNREYSYGRNWTNDHRHINKDEEHEVTYNRKGKFLGIFKEGGAIKNQYAGRTPEDIWDSLSVEQRKHFLIDHLWGNEEQIEQLRYKRLEEDDKEFVDYYAVRTWKKLSGDVRKAFTSHVKEGEYNKGGALTNERLHVNHEEDYEVRYAKPRPKRKGYKGVRKFMAGGMNDESPKIYVADLEAYNNGRLTGEWLDLADYDDADELMEAIQKLLKKSGGEEYAIHDAENIPKSLYSEYMGRNDFQALYEVMETAKRFDLPLEVVQEIVSQYGEGGVEEFQGKYDNAEDFAQQLVDDIGIESFNSYEYYMYVTDTDRRLIAQEQADFYVDNIKDEDSGNRLIEEAGMDVEEYEEADSEMQEEMLDKAREIVYDEVYDQWFEGLDDPKNFLVDEQGMYDTESFANANFVNVDYEKLGRDLEQDYTFIRHDGELYVFNIR